MPEEINTKLRINVVQSAVNQRPVTTLSFSFRRTQDVFTLKVVVVGVLGHAAVQECPCQVVNSILLVLHCFGDNLCIEVVMETVVQVRLHRQRLIQELLEEVLSREEKRNDVSKLL